MRTAVEPSILLENIYVSARDFAIFTLTRDGKISSWNAGAELILGFSALE